VPPPPADDPHAARPKELDAAIKASAQASDETDRRAAQDGAS
jgi:hypothetical protein